MNKDEMKNRISMELKDPILQQGFECICKKIVELEKSCDETQELLDKQIEATYKLDKENAELKKQLSDVRECFISASSGDDFEMAESAREVMEVLNIPCYRHGEVKSKLTEAKEIILKLYNAGRDVLMCRAEEKAYDNLDEAINDRSIEQFLKKVEK